MYHAPWAQPASYNFVMNPNEQLRQEFNQWAEDGRGTEMERHHLYITERAIRQMGYEQESAFSISDAAPDGRRAC